MGKTFGKGKVKIIGPVSQLGLIGNGRWLLTIIWALKNLVGGSRKEKRELRVLLNFQTI